MFFDFRHGHRHQAFAQLMLTSVLAQKERTTHTPIDTHVYTENCDRAQGTSHFFFKHQSSSSCRLCCSSQDFFRCRPNAPHVDSTCTGPNVLLGESRASFASRTFSVCLLVPGTLLCPSYLRSSFFNDSSTVTGSVVVALWTRGQISRT